MKNEEIEQVRNKASRPIRNAAVIATGMLGKALFATAQAASPSAVDLAQPQSDELAEVIVTAEKRNSTVQSTPISLTAVTGEQMQQQGLSRIEDLALETPGISMRSAGPGQTEYEMRGLPSSGGAAPTVGFYLDETPLTAPAAALNGKVTIDPDLFDLNRVEVLRGPQGTLYGSSSMGGTIKLVTNQPKFNQFEGAAQTNLSDTTGGGLNYGGSAMINLPLVDDVAAVRLVGTDKYTDGFIDYKVVQPFPIGPNNGTCIFGSCVRGAVTSAPVVQNTPGANSQRVTGGRLSGRLALNDAFDAELMVMHQQISMGGFSQVDIPPGPDVALTHYQPFAIAEPYRDRFTLYSGTLKYSFAFAELTSATSYWTRDSRFTGDNSETFQSLWSAFYGLTTLLPVAYTENDHSQQTSEEIRLASSGNGPWTWIIGGYLANFTSVFNQYVANPAYANYSTGGPGANPLGVEYQANNPYHVKQYAGFGETTYAFTETLKGTVGVRWYKYDTDMTFEQSGVFSQSGNASPYTGQIATSERGINPKFNLAYIPDGNLTLYSTISKGFRPGGVNLPVPTNICGTQVPLSYSPDSLWNYEVGEKARLLDGRLTVNSDIYYIRWKGVQQFLTLSCGYPYSANAGNAESYGPELEVTTQLTPHLTLSANGAYTKAQIKSVNPSVAGLTLGPSKSLTDGTYLENVPKYTGNLALTYTHPVTDGLKLTARVANVLIGPQYDINYYYTELPSYDLVNLRLGLIGGVFSVYLFADNATNKHALLTINNYAYSIAVPSLTRATVNQPRTVGVDAQIQF
jgi:outer membrane receptor protein involved in Fe transport